MKKTTLPLFLALWAVMMLILGALNVEKQEIMLEGVMETARQDVERDYFMSAEEGLKYGIIDEIYRPLNAT